MKQGSSDRLVLGCMSGTSLDGLDVALVRIKGKGLEISAELLSEISVGFSDQVSQMLCEHCDQRVNPATTREQAATALGDVHARAIEQLLDETSRTPQGFQQIDLVCAHGQTVLHRPPTSIQLLDPEPIAQLLEARLNRTIPIVYDLRAADLAAGGQGAPITPLADFVLFSDEQAPTAVVNLGGFCNVTLLPPRRIENSRTLPQPTDVSMNLLDQIRGFDVCACNQILDAVARTVLRLPYDTDGAAAGAGTCHEDALIDLEGILAVQARSRRSLGTGDEAEEWISRWRAHVKPDDLAATACEAVGCTIARRILECSNSNEGMPRVLLAGGGAKNNTLVKAIQGWLTAKTAMTCDTGIPIHMREAVCMAVLGALCQDEIPITLPKVTGCRHPAPVAGKWWPIRR